MSELSEKLKQFKHPIAKTIVKLLEKQFPEGLSRIADQHEWEKYMKLMNALSDWATRKEFNNYVNPGKQEKGGKSCQ